MSTGTSDPMEMFSKEWYNAYYQRAASSAAHSEFCKRVYGKDLCQHGLMDMDELDFLITLIQPGLMILEIGCPNGFISEYIHDNTGAVIKGVDYSTTANEQARTRIREKSATLSFECLDFTSDILPAQNFNIVLLIDSIHFLGEVKDTLMKLNQRLCEDGRTILSIFQFREDEDPQKILLPQRTFLAQDLNMLGFSYTWFDFTGNVRAHGKKNFQVAEELKEDFIREGNAFLYEARAAENGFFREASERGMITRFMYIIEKYPSIT